MPNFNILKEIDADKTFRVQSIQGMFDLNTTHIREEFKGNINIENKEWNIGVIYGHSGTGKTTIINQLFGEKYIVKFEYTHKSVIDDMPENRNMKDIVRIFNMVGFSSPPSWLKPYSVLSMGERMRVDLANAFLKETEIIVFDEFTSVIDRNVAKISSLAIQKAIRKNNKKFIAVSCHQDIIEYLNPDWIFDTNKMEFIEKKKTSTDLRLNYQYTNVPANIGKYLGSIII